MTSSNPLFGFVQSRAKSVKDIAASRIREAAKKVDEKLKAVEDNLEKDRAKRDALEKEIGKRTVWKPSGENPDGEIIKVTETPPSISVPQSGLSSFIPNILNPSSDIPQASKSSAETQIVQHTKRKSNRSKTVTQLVDNVTDSGHESGSDYRSISRSERQNHRIVVACLHELIDDIVLREDVHYLLEDVLDIIDAVDHLVDQTDLSTPLIISEPEPEREPASEPELESESESESDPTIEETVSSTGTDDVFEESMEHPPMVADVPDDEDEDALFRYFAIESTSSVDVPVGAASSRRESSNSASSSDDFISEIKVTPAQVSTSIEEPIEYRNLRDLISRIEDEDESEEHMAASPDKPVELSPPANENLNSLESSIQETSPVEINDQHSDSSPDQISLDSCLIESIEIIPPPLPPVPEPIKEKRFPVVHSHSLPEEIIITYISCSSQYLYICTSDRKIFYAKLHATSSDLPLKWQQHPDLAERLDVNPSNQGVWRWYDRRLYIAVDPLLEPPLGSEWDEIKLGYQRTCLSCCVNDLCGWFIKDDGSLWLLKRDAQSQRVWHVICPFRLERVVGFGGNIAVSTEHGQILVRYGCTSDLLEGDGWIFVQHDLGPLDDFLLLSKQETIVLVDQQHRLCLRSWSSDEQSFEILPKDDNLQYFRQHLVCANANTLFFTNCKDQIHAFSDTLVGVKWKTVHTTTRFQKLVGAFSDQEDVWALNTDKLICSSNGLVLKKPRQAQCLTHASFVPNAKIQGTVLWTLDESCNIYVRADVSEQNQWQQLDQIQFEWSRRLIHMVCNSAGVWAVDDHGQIYFRHGHAGAYDGPSSGEFSMLPAAWIPIPGAPKKRRTFSQVYCGPAAWMVYATDSKQSVYSRCEITEDNRVGTSWKFIEDCSALELAISEHCLWLLTSHGQIQCRENISVENPIGTRATTLPGFFLSLTVSTDDQQVWALDSNRNLLKLDRLTILLEK